MILDGKSLQEYPVTIKVSRNFCYITTYADDTTLYSKCDQASDFCH